MQLQRQHFLLSYFETLSDGPAGVELLTSFIAAGCSSTEPPVRGILPLQKVKVWSELWLNKFVQVGKFCHGH